MLKQYLILALTIPFILSNFARADQLAPVVSDVQVKYVADTVAMITWTTDEQSNSIIRYDLIDNIWETYTFSKNVAEPVKDHTIIVTNLQPMTEYFFRVGSEDPEGNGPLLNPNATNPSNEMTFTTAVGPDVTAPQIVGDVILTEITDTTVVIEWTTDEPGDSEVQYDTMSASWASYAFSENDSKMDTDHENTITGLAPNTLYFFRVSSTDLFGNNHATSLVDKNPSIEYNFITEDDNGGGGGAPFCFVGSIR